MSPIFCLILNEIREEDTKEMEPNVYNDEEKTKVNKENFPCLGKVIFMK